MGRLDQSYSDPQADKVAPDLIVKAGIVITMAKGEVPIPDVAICIKDGKITGLKRAEARDVSPSIGVEIIDARDAIVMPGLVNAHTHAAMSIFRGLADDLPLEQWLFEKIFPAEAKFLNPETVYYGSLLACLEMIASGTTSFADGYFFEDETAQAVHESGLRALVAQGVIDFPAPGVEDPKENLRTARDFLTRWGGFSSLITPGIFCHSPITCSDRTLRRAWEICREFDVPLQIHLSETLDETNEIMKRVGKRPVHYLDELGLIDNRLIAVHAVHLNEGELECLRASDVKVAHVPESNMKLCSGVARVSEMVKIGLKVGLGTDGCASNNNLDLFQEMDTAAKLSKVFDGDPVSLNAKTVLKMATTWGAALLGLEREIGTIEVGKKADIIVVDVHNAHLCPVYDPISTLVYSANGGDVRDVIVDGKVLMKNREFITLDSAKIMKRVRRLSEEIAI
jgi:5-methylthioadenosine/S-adenosylhomocysteine deaminase